MAILNRDGYIRNHVMGVLSIYSEKGLNYSRMGQLADSLTEAAIEGDRKWHQDNRCEKMRIIEEDVPQ